MKIIVANDDSYRSELLGLLLDIIKDFGEILVVAPEHQQSWRGKSVTRYEDMQFQRRNVFGHEGYLLNGTPADCINFAIYNLCDSPPDLVISGMNAGVNSGTGFIFSSGTVGAALEANIAGIPGIAVSTALDASSWDAFEMSFTVSEVVREQLKEIGLPQLKRLLKTFISDPNFLSEPVTWNINLPVPLVEGAEIVFSSVARDYYQRLFKEVGDECVWDMSSSDIIRDTREEVDRAYLKRGHITVSRLSIADFGQMPEVDCLKFSKKVNS